MTAKKIGPSGQEPPAPDLGPSLAGPPVAWPTETTEDTIYQLTQACKYAMGVNLISDSARKGAELACFALGRFNKALLGHRSGFAGRSKAMAANDLQGRATDGPELYREVTDALKSALIFLTWDTREELNLPRAAGLYREPSV